jgi:hypothetical protein
VEAHALTLLLGSYFYWLRTTIQIIWCAYSGLQKYPWNTSGLFRRSH